MKVIFVVNEQDTNYVVNIIVNGETTYVGNYIPNAIFNIMRKLADVEIKESLLCSDCLEEIPRTRLEECPNCGYDFTT